MSDKERLEKIKDKVNSLLHLGDSEGNGEVNINAIYNDMSWLIEQAEKTQKYREALEEITKVDLIDRKSREHYQTEAVYMKITALKALEGENND